MTNDETRILDLLRTALFGKPLTESLFADMTDSDWERLFHIARNNKVVAVCGDAIATLPTHLRPSRKIWIPWISETKKVELCYKNQIDVLSALTALLSTHDIKTLVLKGPSLGTFYPNPEHREFGDLDLYHYGRWKEADQIVAKHYGVHVSNDAYHHTKYTLNHVTIENHYTFVNSRTQRSNSDYEKILQSLVPSATFETLFHIRHMSGHFASGRIVLRDLADWALFLSNHTDDVDWQLVNKTINEYNIVPFVGNIQAILEDHFGITPHPALKRANDKPLQERILNDIIYGEFDEIEHPKENLGRVFWKIRRYKSNRWKHQLCYSDPWFPTFLRGIFVHLLKPRSIIHKM